MGSWPAGERTLTCPGSKAECNQGQQGKQRPGLHDASWCGVWTAVGIRLLWPSSCQNHLYPLDQAPEVRGPCLAMGQVGRTEGKLPGLIGGHPSWLYIGQTPEDVVAGHCGFLGWVPGGREKAGSI